MITTSESCLYYYNGYRNTIELPVRNNVVPLRFETIRLVENGSLFNRIRSEDPNQHLKEFLKLVDSLDLDGSITIWEDLTIRFLAKFFPPGRIANLRNDILMFQKHHGEYLSEAWTQFKDSSSSTLPSDAVKNPKLSISPVSARSYPTKDPQCSTHVHGLINVVTIHPKQQSDSHDDRTEEDEEEEKDNLENIHVNPSTPPDSSISSSLKKSSNSIHSSNHSGVVRFTNGTDEIADKMPHKIEQYNSLLDSKKVHTKLVYLRNEENKRRGVKYVMSKILGFYKECLELRPEYVTRMDDKGEVT
nr:zinc finger, CCHC-type [Tanacetum cinerariifolium]